MAVTEDNTRNRYLPPFRYRFFTPCYDLFCVILGLGPRFRRKVLEATPITNGDMVLDVGCGTGTMTRLMKTRVPQASVIGIDLDEQALAIARKKADDEGVNITYIKGSAARLPIADRTVDLVTSTLVFHHLPGSVKVLALQEIRRVLKPAGRFVLSDFGKPKTAGRSLLPWLGAHLEEGKENVDGRLPIMIGEAGFQNVRILERPRANIDTIISTAY